MKHIIGTATGIRLNYNMTPAKVFMEASDVGWEKNMRVRD